MVEFAEAEGLARVSFAMLENNIALRVVKVVAD
jgi:hypothetical protein